MRRHWPICRTVLAACAPMALIGWVHSDAWSVVTFSWAGAGWLVLGALYAQLAEFWWHRRPMHRGLPYLEPVRKSHLEHHRIFHGEHFKTRSIEESKYIVGRAWIFPVLLFGHYAALGFVLERAALLVFLLGAVIHYVAFELAHWFTHVDGNSVDRALTRIPLLSGIRAYQIEHHRIHHERPEIAFNFSPPYLGDRLAGLMPDLTEVRPSHVAAPPVPVVAAPVSAAWRGRLVRYGSVAAVGLAVLGLVVVGKRQMSRRQAA